LTDIIIVIIVAVPLLGMGLLIGGLFADGFSCGKRPSLGKNVAGTTPEKALRYLSTTQWTEERPGKQIRT